MQLIQKAVSELIPYVNNSRLHSELQIAQIAASIREFGFTNPCLIDEQNNVIAGHGRIKAAHLLGMAEIPCIVLIGLTEAKRKALVIADNNLALNASWDMDALKLEIGALNDMKFDINILGFDDDFLSKLLAAPIGPDEGEDDVPPIGQNGHGVIEGDIWKLGEHRLLCGDSTNIQHVEKLMDGITADLLWTDPPYNVALGMDETPEEAKARNRRTDGLTVKNDKMSDEQFREFLKSVFLCAHCVMKDGASFYIAHSDSEGYNFRGAVKDAGLTLKQCLIWAKSSLVMGRQDYQWQHEPILYGWKLGASHHWYSDRKQTTLLQFDKPSKNGEHPTMKPVQLIEYCMANSTQQGAVILDLFLGSGSTLMAAEKNHRRCYGLEIDPHYCSVIIERWQKYTGKIAERV